MWKMRRKTLNGEISGIALSTLQVTQLLCQKGFFAQAPFSHQQTWNFWVVNELHSKLHLLWKLVSVQSDLLQLPVDAWAEVFPSLVDATCLCLLCLMFFLMTDDMIGLKNFVNKENSWWWMNCHIHWSACLWDCHAKCALSCHQKLARGGHCVRADSIFPDMQCQEIDVLTFLKVWCLFLSSGLHFKSLSWVVWGSSSIESCKNSMCWIENHFQHVLTCCIAEN